MLLSGTTTIEHDGFLYTSLYRALATGEVPQHFEGESKFTDIENGGWQICPNDQGVIEHVCRKFDWSANFICTRGDVHATRQQGYWLSTDKIVPDDERRLKKTYEKDSRGWVRCIVPNGRLLIRKKRNGGGATKPAQALWEGEVRLGSRRFENGTLLIERGGKTPRPGYLHMENPDKVNHTVQVNGDHGTISNVPFL